MASNDFSTFFRRSYTQFDWETIFRTQDDINTNQFRSAEFIAFYSNPTLTISALIPAQFIKRILVPAQYEPMIKEILASVQDRIYSLENTNVFFPKEAVPQINYRTLLYIKTMTVNQHKSKVHDTPRSTRYKILNT